MIYVWATAPLMRGQQTNLADENASKENVGFLRS